MTQSRNTLLLFLAFIPPVAIQNRVTAIKQSIAEQYDSSAALKSPPHITLHPPFRWSPENVEAMNRCLQEFACDRVPVPISLNGFRAFAPKVIYIQVCNTPALLTLQQEIQAVMENSLGISMTGTKRPFSPHMTVAFRDLSPYQFKQAWSNFQHRSFEANFIVKTLTLLKHNGKIWEVWKEFPLSHSETAG